MRFGNLVMKMWDVESLKFKRAAGYFLWICFILFSRLVFNKPHTTKHQYRVPVSSIQPWQKHAAHLIFNYWLSVTACIKFKALMHTGPHLSAPSDLSLFLQIYKLLVWVSEQLLFESYEVIFKHLYKTSLYLTVQGLQNFSVQSTEVGQSPCFASHKFWVFAFKSWVKIDKSKLSRKSSTSSIKSLTSN